MHPRSRSAGSRHPIGGRGASQPEGAAAGRPERLGDLYLEFAASTEGMQFLEAQQDELVGPRNDPEYLKALVARDKEREIAANAITVLHHIVKHGRSYVALTFKNDRDLAKTREVFRILQRLLEAEHRCHADPHDPLKSPVTSQKRPARQEFGREKRSSVRKTKKLHDLP